MNSLLLYCITVIVRLLARLSLWIIVYTAAASRADFCLHESFNASCRPGTVVLMTSASYGRMRLGRCIVGDYNIGCATNVVGYMHGQCTGRPACDVPVRNLVDTHPCQRDFMSYLEATYTCIEGQQLDFCHIICMQPYVTFGRWTVRYTGWPG